MAAGSFSLGTPTLDLPEVGLYRWTFDNGNKPELDFGNGQKRFLYQLTLSTTNAGVDLTFHLTQQSNGSQGGGLPESTGFLLVHGNSSQEIGLLNAMSTGSGYSKVLSDADAYIAFVTAAREDEGFRNLSVLWDTDGVPSAPGTSNRIPFAVFSVDHGDLVIMGHELKDLIINETVIYRKG